MRQALTLVLAVLAAAATAAPAAAEAPPFDWTMPARLGPDRNGDGLIDYAGSAGSVAAGPFTVILKVRPDLCHERSLYRWSVAGKPIAGGLGDCDPRERFASEGTYGVELEVEDSAGRRATYSRDVVVQDWLVVSIGDSVASGEGNPDVPGFVRRARWQSPRCHRSSLAAPVVAARSLEDSDPRTSTTFVHLACSGAEIDTGLLEGYVGADAPDNAEPRLLPPQVAELEAIASQRQVDAVMVSIGANDVHFGPLAAFCLRFSHCITRNFDPAHPLRGDLSSQQAESVPKVIGDALANLRTKYEALAERLSRVVPPNRVLIVDYFDPTHDEEGQTCKQIGVPFFSIDEDEATWASTHLLAPLNHEIAEAASRAGWTEVNGVAEAFRTHGYCAGRKSWIRSLGRSLLSQAGATAASRRIGTLHPNEEGQRAIAALLGPALLRSLYASEAGAEPATGGDAGVAVEPEGSAGEPAGGCECAAGCECEQQRCNSGCDKNDSGESVEGPALIGLLAALAVAALALIAAVLWGRRREGAAWEAAAEGTVPPLISDRLPSRSEADAFGALLERSSEWVHRRVESIEFLDESTIRRRVSVDFSPADADLDVSPQHAPIALLHKGVLTRFDLRDEAGDSLPLLTANQNAAFATAHMLSVAEKAIGGRPSPRLRDLCWTIARAEPRQAKMAIEEIAQRLEPEAERERLRDDPLFRSITQTFAGNFPVIVEIDDPARRRVVKLAYDEIVGRRPRLSVMLGLNPLGLTIDMPELGDAGSRHIEFLSSDGLEAFDPALIARTPEGKPLVRRAAARVGREVHLLITDAPKGSAGVAGVRLRAKREGILVGGPLYATLSAALLSITWFALPDLPGNSSEAASALLAVPAALGTYLGARSPHPLVAAMLGGARALLVATGLLSFAAATALALDCSAGDLRVILGIAAPLSWLTAAGLVTILILPRAPRRRFRPEGP